MTWFSLLIPAVVVAILWSNAIYGEKVVWWEYLLLFGTPGIAIVISYFIAVGTQQVDTEYWNGYVTGATYFQSWQEWDHQTCYRDCNCRTVGSGDDKRRVCDRCSYDCSHCDNHAERWEASDNLGNSWNITPANFETWASSWGNRTFVELNRRINCHNGVFQTCGQMTKLKPIV